MVLQKELLGKRPQHNSLEEGFQVYRQLYEEQQGIVESGEDTKTLRMRLLSLPTLKRVTLTSETWRLFHVLQVRVAVLPIVATRLPYAASLALAWLMF